MMEKTATPIVDGWLLKPAKGGRFGHRQFFRRRILHRDYIIRSSGDARSPPLHPLSRLFLLPLTFDVRRSLLCSSFRCSVFNVQCSMFDVFLFPTPPLSS